MPKEDWGILNEKAFEAALQASVPERLPDEVAAAVTPWKRAMRRVLVGTALTAVGTNLCGLNYLLPGIGLLLMLLGFRLLRRENRWFRCCFLLTGMQLAYCVFQLILRATLYHEAYTVSAAGEMLSCLNVFLQLAQSFCLWRGLLAVQREAGLPPHAKGAAALVVWYLLLSLLALTGFGAELAALVMLAAYVLILCSIRRTYRELDEAGYAVKPAGIRVPDWCIAAGLAVTVLAGCGVGLCRSSRYPMQWQPETPREETELAVQLLELGFPDYVLQDLRPEEIDACRGAIQVVVSVQEFDQEGGFCHSSGSNPLCITGVGVKLTGEPAGWMIFHHFLWNTPPSFHGTAAIQLWPVYQLDELWSAAGEVTGRVLCEQNGETFWAPYHSLEEDTSPYEYQGIYGQRDIFGTFSLSTTAQHGRGYVVYAADEIPHAEYRNMLDSRFHYSYQYRFLQYPAKTALENRMSNHGAFRTVWSDLRCGPEVTPPVIKKNDQRNDPPAKARGSF